MQRSRKKQINTNRKGKIYPMSNLTYDDYRYQVEAAAVACQIADSELMEARQLVMTRELKSKLVHYQHQVAVETLKEIDKVLAEKRTQTAGGTQNAV